MDKFFLMTEKSKLDSQHMGKTKVVINEAMSLNNDKSGLTVYYCSLGGCDVLFKPCSEGCPYASREYIRFGSDEHTLQLSILELKKPLEEEELLVKFVENDFNKDELEQIIEILAGRVSRSTLEKIQKINEPVIKAALVRHEEKSKKYEKEWKRRYIDARIIGEYLHIKLSGLPNVINGGKKYWYQHGFLGSWVKLSDIDSYFIETIKTPDFMNNNKEKREEYASQVEALMEFLEKNFQISTLIELMES